MCLPYCKNDLEMSNAKEEQDFVSAAQTVFVVTCEIKAFSTMPSMGCDVFGLASLKSNMSPSFAYISAEFLKTFQGRSENNLPTSETGCGWTCHVIFNQKG